MFRPFAIGIVWLILGLTACATPAPSREPEKVSPGELYKGSYLNIAAPNSQGWSLLSSSTGGMAFARGGNSPDESFVAAVLRFDAPQTSSPEEFEALIVQGAQRDAKTARFNTSEFTHQYSDARGYSCVQMRSVSQDRQAQVGGGKIETLILESEHLYCRHPIQKKLGFALTYSHRGHGLHPTLHSEAQAFFQGVQVPETQSTQNSKQGDAADAVKRRD